MINKEASQITIFFYSLDIYATIKSAPQSSIPSPLPIS